jgi:ADP-heptose:LPS heptosyltransferase
MKNHEKNIAWIVRCDHLGDLIITLPIIAQIKQKYEVKIIVEKYIYDFAKYFIKTIDIILTDDFLRMKNFSANDILVPFSMSKAIRQHTRENFHGVKLGYVFRSKDWLYADKLSRVYRANKSTHEAELLRQFAQVGITHLTPLTELDYKTNWLFEFGFQQTTALEKKLRKKIILHPGSNMNGREWPATHWAKLIDLIDIKKYEIFVTGRAEESKRFLPFFNDIKNEYTNCINQDVTIVDFANRVMDVDLLVSSGTGPAHIAASLGVSVIALYPPIKTAGVSRWHPIGSNTHAMLSPNFDAQSFCKNYRQCDSSNCACMHEISPEMVLDKIYSLLD